MVHQALPHRAARTLHEVEYATRQTNPVPQLGERLADHRAVLRRLEHDAVPAQDCCRRADHGVGEREDARVDDRDHAARNEVATAGDVLHDAGGHEANPVVEEQVDGAQTGGYLLAGFPQRLAGLPDEERRDGLGKAGQLVAKPLNRRGPLHEANPPPSPTALVGGLHRIVHAPEAEREPTQAVAPIARIHGVQEAVNRFRLDERAPQVVAAPQNPVGKLGGEVRAHGREYSA